MPTTDFAAGVSFFSASAGASCGFSVAISPGILLEEKRRHHSISIQVLDWYPSVEKVVAEQILANTGSGMTFNPNKFSSRGARIMIYVGVVRSILLDLWSTLWTSSWASKRWTQIKSLSRKLNRSPVELRNNPLNLRQLIYSFAVPKINQKRRNWSHAVLVRRLRRLVTRVLWKMAKRTA